jgi:hypothetical protein
VTIGAFDSGLYCPHCYAAPALFIRVADKKHMKAECPICAREYTVERRGDRFQMVVDISTEELLGANGMTILRQLVRAGRIRDDTATIDKETRRQMYKLATLGLARSFVSENKEEAFWEPTPKALEMVRWCR